MLKKQSDQDALNPDHLLTVKDVMQILHMSRSFVYELVARGLLPAAHIGRRLRFRPEDVQRYIGKSTAANANVTVAASRKKH